MTTMTKDKPMASRQELLQAGSKRIMGVARAKRLDSEEALSLVIRWGVYIDQADHPPVACERCSHELVWDSIHLRYNHSESGHQWCSSHAGGTAIGH